MASTARQVDTVAGDEIFLWVQEGSAWTLWGCMDQFSFKSTIEAFEINCRTFAAKTPSGKDPQWSISTGGFYRIFNEDDEETNISVKKSYGFHAAKTVITVKFGTVHTADPIWTGKAFVSEFELNGNQGEAAKYSLTLEGASAIVVSAQPA